MVSLPTKLAAGREVLQSKPIPVAARRVISNESMMRSNVFLLLIVPHHMRLGSTMIGMNPPHTMNRRYIYDDTTLSSVIS